MGYRDDINQARMDALHEFHTINSNYSLLIEMICEVVFSQVVELQSKAKLSNYQNKLLASFLRSLVVSVDLIEKSDLVEAVTILRKQVELLARLYELENKELIKLSAKTPNISSLKTKIKTMYSKFSQGAHSATYGSMSLLGFYKNRVRRRPVIYPEFTENTEIIFSNWIFVYFEFTIFILEFKRNNFVGYDENEDEKRFFDVYKFYESTGIKQKYAENDNN